MAQQVCPRCEKPIEAGQARCAECNLDLSPTGREAYYTQAATPAPPIVIQQQGATTSSVVLGIVGIILLLLFFFFCGMPFLAGLLSATVPH